MRSISVNAIDDVPSYTSGLHVCVAITEPGYFTDFIAMDWRVFTPYRLFWRFHVPCIRAVIMIEKVKMIILPIRTCPLGDICE